MTSDPLQDLFQAAWSLVVGRQSAGAHNPHWFLAKRGLGEALEEAIEPFLIRDETGDVTGFVQGAELEYERWEYVVSTSFGKSLHFDNEKAAKYRREKAREAGDEDAKAEKRLCRAYADGSEWTGPWQEVPG